MTTKADKVRAFLAAQTGPVTSAQIARGAGLTPDQLNSTMADFQRTGMVNRYGDAPPYRYTLGRQPKVVYRYATEELRKRAKRENHNRQVERQRRKRAEARAAATATAAARDAEKARKREAEQAARNEARAKREAARAAAKATRDAAKTPRPAPNRRPEAQQPKVRNEHREPRIPREVAAAPPREVLPDSSAWIAANQDKVIRLPIDAPWRSSPLKRDQRRRA